MTTELRNATVEPRANVYFDGKCVSHTVTMPDGSRKSVGVILPAALTFKTGAPEVMELVEGECRVRLAGGEWTSYAGGQSFRVGGDSAFDIEVTRAVHYICHFG